LSAQSIAERDSTRKLGAQKPAAENNKQMLFGDLYVHSTYSIDAFTLELPLMRRGLFYWVSVI